MAGGKANVLWRVNIVSFVLVAVLATTGLINWLVLPHGGPGASGVLVSIRHALRDIHAWTAALFIVAVGVHLALHWGYVKANLKRSGLLKSA